MNQLLKIGLSEKRTWFKKKHGESKKSEKEAEKGRKIHKERMVLIKRISKT